jgi:uncharacterized protein (TIGR02679 family)
VGDDLAWFWAQVSAAADRRGDPHLKTRSVTVTAPDDVAGRTAGAGLLGRRHLRAGQRVSVDLAALADRIAPLTPGVVAAHTTGRRLAVRAAEADARAASELDLRARVLERIPALGDDGAWAALRRSGWVTRVLQAEDPRLVERAAAVLSQLPSPGDPPVDRRVLAQAASADPHNLDAGRLTGGLVLAILAATSRIAASASRREAWAAVGVSFDDITGGLTLLGIAPVGWVVPGGAPVTLPPRVLADCLWPQPAGASVFVTENPSVLGAATTLAGARVICTSGTPARVEVDALGRLAARGWGLHVRADFDDAGLNHVRALLAAADTAVPWRMTAADYLAAVESDDAVGLRVDRIGETPWDPLLREAMVARGVAAFEEELLDALLGDIRRGAAAEASCGHIPTG